MADREWYARKEYRSADPFSGERCMLSDDEGRHAEGWGSNREEARDNAYKHWREKYG